MDQRKLDAAFEGFRTRQFGRNREYPVEAYTYFVAGFKAAAPTDPIENASFWPRPWRAEVHHGMNRSTIYDADGYKIIAGMNNEKAEFIAACVNAALPPE